MKIKDLVDTLSITQEIIILVNSMIVFKGPAVKAKEFVESSANCVRSEVLSTRIKNKTLVIECYD